VLVYEHSHAGHDTDAAQPRCGGYGILLTQKSGEKVICRDFNGCRHKLIQIDDQGHVLRERWVEAQGETL
jgi:hypothetical protein